MGELYGRDLHAACRDLDTIALTLAALVICLLLTLFGAGRKEDR
jgi:hypothetical protein